MPTITQRNQTIQNQPYGGMGQVGATGAAGQNYQTQNPYGPGGSGSQNAFFGNQRPRPTRFNQGIVNGPMGGIYNPQGYDPTGGHTFTNEYNTGNPGVVTRPGQQYPDSTGAASGNELPLTSTALVNLNALPGLAPIGINNAPDWRSQPFDPSTNYIPLNNPGAPGQDQIDAAQAGTLAQIANPGPNQTVGSTPLGPTLTTVTPGTGQQQSGTLPPGYDTGTNIAGTGADPLQQPPVNQPAAGQQPPVIPPVGAAGQQPPVIPPVGAAGQQPPVIPPVGAAGQQPPVIPPVGAAGQQPPAANPAGGGGGGGGIGGAGGGVNFVDGPLDVAPGVGDYSTNVGNVVQRTPEEAARAWADLGMNPADMPPGWGQGGQDTQTDVPGSGAVTINGEFYGLTPEQAELQWIAQGGTVTDMPPGWGQGAPPEGSFGGITGGRHVLPPGTTSPTLNGLPPGQWPQSEDGNMPPDQVRAMEEAGWELQNGQWVPKGHVWENFPDPAMGGQWVPRDATGGGGGLPPGYDGGTGAGGMTPVGQYPDIAGATNQAQQTTTQQAQYPTQDRVATGSQAPSGNLVQNLARLAERVGGGSGASASGGMFGGQGAGGGSASGGSQGAASPVQPQVVSFFDNLNSAYGKAGADPNATSTITFMDGNKRVTKQVTPGEVSKVNGFMDSLREAGANAGGAVEFTHGGYRAAKNIPPGDSGKVRSFLSSLRS